MVFTSPGIDIYLFVITGLKYHPVHLKMKGLHPSMGIQHTTLDWIEVTTGRNIIAMVDKGQNVSIKYVYGVTYQYYNAWGGFSVSGYMNPLVTFNVARHTSKMVPGLVRFDTEIVNTGQFNMNSSTFIAAIDGIYYFSISAGLEENIILELMLKVNDIDIYNLLHRCNIHNEEESISGTTLLDLQAGDKVTLHLTEGQMHSSFELHEVSVVCFLYSPESASSIAWVISSTNGLTSMRRGGIIYDKVDVVSGVNLDTLGTIVIPVTGVYYIYFSAVIPLDIGVHMVLKQNGDMITGLYIKNWDVPRCKDLISTGLSFIYTFRRGDRLSVNPSYYPMPIMGNKKRSTSFMGFLIKETI